MSRLGQSFATQAALDARVALSRRATLLRLRLAMAAVAVAYQAKCNALDEGAVRALEAQALPFAEDDVMARAARDFCGRWRPVRRDAVALAAAGDALLRAVRGAVGPVDRRGVVVDD